jgi:hypothetical protein
LSEIPPRHSRTIHPQNPLRNCEPYLRLLHHETFE